MSPPARHPASQAVPILEVANALGLPVRDRKAPCFNGQDHRQGHDRTPSLVFFVDSNRYKCFGCGQAGDTIDLVRAVRGLSFQAAVAWLDQLANHVVPTTVNKGVLDVGKSRLPGLADFPVYEHLYNLAQPTAADTPAGRYLLGRGLDPVLAAVQGTREIIDVASVWLELLEEFGSDRLSSAGLVSRSGSFLFGRHRLLFFYRDDGRPVFVQGRDITGTADVKELRPTRLQCPVPFNRDLLRTPHEHVYLCEGCIDTLSALLLSCPAIGIPGVQAFRDEWFALFDRAQHIRLAFDNDDAGRREGAKLQTQFRLRGFRADAFHPAQGKDVNDLLQSISKGAIS